MPKLYNIITHPNKFLRQNTEDINIDQIKTDEIQNLIDSLIFTMKKKDGIGLAAIQVGINKSIVIINSKDEPLVLINPKIISKSFRKTTMEEGCLSVPNVYGAVKRPKNIKINAYDSNGQEINEKYTGLISKIIQHEIDHLNGILFIDKAIKTFKNV